MKRRSNTVTIRLKLEAVDPRVERLVDMFADFEHRLGFLEKRAARSARTSRAVATAGNSSPQRGSEDA